MSRDSGARTAGSDRTRYETILETVGDGVYELDPAGRFIDVNEVITEVTGYSREKLLGEHASLVLSESDLNKCETAVYDLVTSDDRPVAVVEVEVEPADGSTIPAEIRLSALVEDGEFRGSVGVVRDLTDRYERKVKYRQERALNERILEAIPASVGVIDRDGEFVRSNPRADARLGTDSLDDEQYTVGARDVYDAAGEFVPTDERPYARIFETGEPVRGWECQIDLPELGRRWLSINVEPILDESGNVELAAITAEDVTALKRRNEKLESELGDIFSRIDDAFFAIDDEWRFTYINDRAKDLLGEDGREITGRSFHEVFPEATDSTFVESCRRALTAQEAVTFEERFPPLDAWYEVRAYPSETGLSVYFRDVTERKRREQTLQRLNEATQDFPHMSSHEAVADRLVGVARDVLGLAEVTVYRHDARKDTLVPTACAGPVSAFGLQPIAVSTGTGPIERAVRDGETVVMEDQQSEIASAAAGSIRRGVVVPVGDHGVLLAGDRQTGDLTSQVVDLAELLAANATSAFDRIDREEELRSRMRQQAVVAALGRHGIADREIDELFEVVVEEVADTLDNEYCKILDLREDDGDLLLRAGVGWRDGLVGEATVDANDNSQAGYTLESEEPVVVDSLADEGRFSGPELLTSHDVVSGISTIIGPSDDPWGILGTHDAERREFSRHDVNFVQSVANILATAIERAEHEERLDHRREQLAALDRINQVVHDVNHAVVEQSTREELAQQVCDRLAESESYAFAWASMVDARTGDVTVLAEAGVERYLSDDTRSLDDETIPGPVVTAVETGEVEAVRDALNDPAYEPWCPEARELGYRSMVTIPVTYGNTVYGVLCVYTARERAFGDEELEVIGQLGEILGHAATAIERKHALISDTVVEIEFRIPNELESIGVDFAEGEIVLERIIHIRGETFLVYGEAATNALGDLRRFADRHDAIDQIETFDESDGVVRFELRLSNPPVGTTIADHGGRVQSVAFENTDVYVRAEIPPGEDVRSVAERLEERYHRVELTSQQRVDRTPRSTQQLRSSVLESLTERQRATLEAAYFSGYFEWPRETDGMEVAEAMGVSSPTFHQHLRTGQQKLLEIVLTEGEETSAQP